jgi:hypothetical protein
VKRKLPKIDQKKLPSADDIRARMAKLEKEREDKRTLRGQYAPKSGTCRVCSGNVAPNITYPYSRMIGGPPLQAYVKDWSCEGCGIVYKFPPKDVPRPVRVLPSAPLYTGLRVSKTRAKR